jgi:hypothetical protein
MLRKSSELKLGDISRMGFVDWSPLTLAFFLKKFTFCLNTKSNKKIKAKHPEALVLKKLLVLPGETKTYSL